MSGQVVQDEKLEVLRRELLAKAYALILSPNWSRVDEGKQEGKNDASSKQNTQQ